MKKAFSQDNESLGAVTIRRAKDAISTELDGETIILNIETGVYNGLDQVGTTVWKQIEEPTTFDQLVSVILDEYKVNRRQCIDDLCSFLTDMLENKLIEADDNATDSIRQTETS
ncbi:MAG: PqqD family protein [Proteobacteria bacterium]|nr:MAG: PqqD family protein [Pseudomonadota bacterium]PIE65410.1 MAG: PqqD family protein [Desulfobacterales bacterium]